ncbi:MAG: ribbon-helix-helix protein, CopG family [Rubrivivax sp.]|nr:ribbon-helix-helix protein, CopG family [Rubrivivax sp.]
MTVTIKLETALEEQLRQRAAATGRSTSEVVRAALQAYLAHGETGPSRSAFELGAELFGRHRGPASLARDRKRTLADTWAERQARRG